MLAGLHVLAAAQLDHQASFDASEIRDEFSDRMLSTELEAVHLLHAQCSPQKPFDIGRVASQLP
jgi:hypothetical protein